jgi:hypothetical protein
VSVAIILLQLAADSTISPLQPAKAYYLPSGTIIIDPSLEFYWPLH